MDQGMRCFLYALCSIVGSRADKRAFGVAGDGFVTSFLTWAHEAFKAFSSVPTA